MLRGKGGGSSVIFHESGCETMETIDLADVLVSWSVTRGVQVLGWLRLSRLCNWSVRPGAAHYLSPGGRRILVVSQINLPDPPQGF